MRTDDLSEQEKFDKLLAWLDPDKDRAGIRYLEIREGLVRFFIAKGCFDEESLADETIDRVAERTDSLILDFDTRSIRVFYGFAKNVYFESIRDDKRFPFQLDESIPVYASEDDQNRKDVLSCLDDCVKKIGKADADMTVRYFSLKGRKRTAARQRMADEMGITIGNLRVRVLRIKDSLRKCVRKCLDSR